MHDDLAWQMRLLPLRDVLEHSLNHKRIPTSTLMVKMNFHLSTPSAQCSQGILTDDNLFKHLFLTFRQRNILLCMHKVLQNQNIFTGN